MSIMLNARGTSIPYFTIGKTGITFYQGSADPTLSYAPNNGDYWFNTSNDQLNVWKNSTSEWIAPRLADIEFINNSISSIAGQDLILTTDSSHQVVIDTSNIILGNGAATSLYGQKSFANGNFSSAGDAQHAIYVLRNETTNATPTELFLDGTSARLNIPFNSVVTFSITVAARRTDISSATGAGYTFKGIVKKDSANNTISFIGTPSKTLLGESDSQWDFDISTDTSGYLKLIATGKINNTIRWVATVRTTEVTN